MRGALALPPSVTVRDYMHCQLSAPATSVTPLLPPRFSSSTFHARLVYRRPFLCLGCKTVPD